MKNKKVTAREFYEITYGNAECVSQIEVIKLLNHFAQITNEYDKRIDELEKLLHSGVKRVYVLLIFDSNDKLSLINSFSTIDKLNEFIKIAFHKNKKFKNNKQYQKMIINEYRLECHEIIIR